MIHTLTTWVFQRVVEQLAAWRASGLELQIAINLSMRNLQEPAVLASIERLLEDGSIPNALLEFEITESALLLDPRLAAKLFERWRAYGVTVAVDDFGTGNASLAYVKDLPVDVLKIDQVFIKSLQNSRRDQAIVHAAIALARDLGLKTVAEGVENLDVLAHLRDRACDYAQGYAIQKPLPPAELDAWFTQSGHGFTVRRAASA